MDDVRNSRKASELAPVSSVVRHFVGARTERDVLVRVFDVVWDVSRVAVSLDQSQSSSSVETAQLARAKGSAS